MIVVITLFIKHQNRWRLSNWNLLILHLHYSRSYYIYINAFTIPFMTLRNSSHLVLQNHSCMRCLVTSNEIFSLTSQKGGSIAGVDYLKVRNDVIHCKTIISDRSQIHAAPNFLLLSSWIAKFVTITSYTLLHQATRDEGKTSLRRSRDIFVSDRDPQRFFCINLWCDTLLQVI